jgi:hypothetical protein
MAGYLFSLDSQSALGVCAQMGVYATKLSQPKNEKWRAPQEGTFADYSSMRAGDNVYFFVKRQIYGIGKLVKIHGHSRYHNFPHASTPSRFQYQQIQRDLLCDLGVGSEVQRFICFFRPDPCFFTTGVDMDDVLSSDPSRFKMLRVFWKRSFIKFDDDENQAFRNVLLQRNSFGNRWSLRYSTKHAATHVKIGAKIMSKRGYDLSVTPLLSSTAKGNGRVGHEAALEAGLVHQICERDSHTIKVFGKWDYVSHQVHASPFKPVDYMDKMDIFGYRYIPKHSPTISKFLIIELKAGSVGAADLLQLMKYVDWVKNEYASGDYSLIKAFVVGHSVNPGCQRTLKHSVERNFIYGFRPSTPMRWDDVTLVTYSYDSLRKRLDFNAVK